MAAITPLDTRTDPATLSPIQWTTRLAAFKSRLIDDTDPRVVECRAALAYWRVRRVLDAERGHLSPDHTKALAEHLRAAVSA